MVVSHRASARFCWFSVYSPTSGAPNGRQSGGEAFDVVILHGHIIDGTGSPWYSGDVGIRDGRIAAIGNLAGAPAKKTIDAQGMVVAPGFIDMLGQSELTLLVDPRAPSKIYQGITTEITGEGDTSLRKRMRRLLPTRPNTSITASRPTGGRSPNISRVFGSRGSGSISARTLAQRRFAAT